MLTAYGLEPVAPVGEEARRRRVHYACSLSLVPLETFGVKQWVGLDFMTGFNVLTERSFMYFSMAPEQETCTT